MPEAAVPLSGETSPTRPGHGSRFTSAPLAVRVYLAVACLSAVALPLSWRFLDPHGVTPGHAGTAAMLVAISVFNVEMSRRLSGGLTRTHQPHKALSAWAFATALLLPSPGWLLVVVPLTYAHARWRGLRLPLWKWVGSAAFLVLAGTAAVAVRHLVMGESNDWMYANGGRGLVAMLVAAAAFLAVESLLFAGSALLGDAADEEWLRRTLTGRSFYATEAGVLLIGGLLAAVWTGGAWFVLFFVPIYGLAQRAALHEELRERADAAAELAARNRDLELANQFKTDLMGVLGHEIGNPLSVVLLHTELALETLDEEDDVDAGDLRRTLAVVERNSLQVRQVLHDLVVLVSSDHGALGAHPEPTLLRPHLVAAADSQPPAARPYVDCGRDVGVLVQPGHLDQMLSNLLVNAMKYGGGATVVTARHVADGGVEITVADEGPGVPEAFRDRLFDRFSRDAESATKVTGTGLGLYITRELARANGGDVVHRPSTPHGAHFVIQLRRAEPAG